MYVCNTFHVLSLYLDPYQERKDAYQFNSYFSFEYRKVTSSNTSCLEAYAGFFRLLMKGIFDPYVLWFFDKKLIS